MQIGAGGTEITDGFIPHIRVHVGSQIIDAPVKVKQERGRYNDTKRLRPIVNDQGKYVHALPGGLEVAGGYKR